MRINLNRSLFSPVVLPNSKAIFPSVFLQYEELPSKDPNVIVLLDKEELNLL